MNQIQAYHPMTYSGAVQVALGKYLKGPLWPLPPEDKLILVTKNLYLLQFFHESP